MRESGNHRIRVNYGIYRPGIPKTLLFLTEGFALGCGVCWLAYNDLRALPLAGIVAVLFLKVRTRELKAKRRQDLLYHFRDFITSLHAAMRAGYSVENGVISAAKDVEMLYGEKDVLVKELTNISAQLKVRARVEDLFAELGERSGLEDIRMFAQLLAIGKKTGGNMNRLLSQTSRILCDKIDTRQEIDAQIAAKAFEQKIMSAMPACIIVYMRVSFQGFIETLYHNAFGIIVMSVCLTVYAIAFFWGRKIVRVEIV